MFYPIIFPIDGFLDNPSNINSSILNLSKHIDALIIIIEELNSDRLKPVLEALSDDKLKNTVEEFNQIKDELTLNRKLKSLLNCDWDTVYHIAEMWPQYNAQDKENLIKVGLWNQAINKID